MVQGFLSEEMSVFHGAICQLLRGDYLFGIKWKVIETVKDDSSQTRKPSVSRGIRLVDMGAGGRAPRRCSVAARCVSLDARRDKAQAVSRSGATVSEVV